MAEPTAAAPRARALFVAADLPWPLDGGGRIASHRVLESLCRRYEVDLVAMADVDGEPDLGPLPAMCGRIRVVGVPFTLGRHRVRQLLTYARSVVSATPYRVRKFENKAFEQALAEMLSGAAYELVQFDQFGSFPYAGSAPAAAVRMASHQNVESELYRLARGSGGSIRRILAGREAAKLRRAEPRLLAAFDRVLTLAPEDTDLLADLGLSRVTTLPLPAQPAAGAPASPPREPRLISLGSMSWYGVADGLLWFHDRVLPLVRRAVPDVEWLLAGPNAPRSIRRLSAERGIDVAGYVPDIDAELRRARVGIVPLQVASGVRVKILHFMELGVPAVSTSVGARGLAFGDGAGCYRRDDPEGFASAVVDLLTDDDSWREVAAAGRTYLAEHHSRARFDAAVDEALDLAVRDARIRRS